LCNFHYWLTVYSQITNTWTTIAIMQLRYYNGLAQILLLWYFLHSDSSSRSSSSMAMVISIQQQLYIGFYLR